MRIAAAVVACCLAFAAPAAATDRIGSEPVNLVIDHARVLKLPDQTQTVIVGNPIIADISAQRNGIVVLTGKSYGRTNFIALDASGSILTETTISVQAPSESMVTVQRGFDRESYSCTPDCQPSLLLGDATKYFSDVGGQAGQRNQLATSK